MRIAVVDGQGGGIGKAVVARLREAFAGAHILALGTNALATSAMLRAGADEGASGENAVVVNAKTVDVIVGSVAILAADSMLGEVTPAMARAISSSGARKVLIPLNRCGVLVAGTNSVSLPHYLDDVVRIVGELAADAADGAH